MPKRKPIEFIVDARGCFVCVNKAKNAGGYCYYQRKLGRRQYAHRHIYEECFGFIPDSLIVRHSCDNPACINPEHLLIGTDLDNARDRVSRGRTPDMRGENGPGAKLTLKEVIEIRAEKLTGNREMAGRFGVTHSNISAIRLGKSWKNVDQEASQIVEAGL